ncbi:hypothetical protein [Clostridium sp.]|uniref:hypothetical protein n=1 Tax=Clostridium sp. TaxID=1506 RepID=UPI00290EC936|nr:hypothetical protein [Clostridium sp.]MDU5108699.1 hypothetical protein [Clostridium sp.]
MDGMAVTIGMAVITGMAATIGMVVIIGTAVIIGMDGMAAIDAEETAIVIIVALITAMVGFCFKNY